MLLGEWESAKNKLGRKSGKKIANENEKTYNQTNLDNGIDTI